MLLLCSMGGTGQYTKSMCVWKESHSGACLTCPTGGMPTLRHKDLRDLTADLMSEVCPNVYTEPELQPLSGEVLHFWEKSQDALFDVRGFNPFASTNCSQSLTATYQHHEKRRGEAMSNASVRWNMVCSPSFSQQQVGERQPMLHTEDWCQCWRRNEISHTAS